MINEFVIVPCSSLPGGERGRPARVADGLQQDRRGQHGRGVRRHGEGDRPPRRRQDDESEAAATARTAL